MDLVRDAHPGDPLLDMAVTHALLEDVAAGAAGATARVFRPGPTLAFGRLDALRDGFGAAIAAARAHGYTPVLRLAGGHAAAYDEGSVLVEVVTPQAVVAEGIDARFRVATAIVVDALAAVGVRAQVGELPGEYCPGAWSVSADGVKLAGTAQRSIRGAALTTSVVVASDGARVRAVLVAVYRALGIEFEPRTAGAVDDLVPTASAPAVEAALAGRVGAAREVALGARTLTAARNLSHLHHPGLLGDPGAGRTRSSP